MIRPRVPLLRQHLDERAAAEPERNERLRRSFAISNLDEDRRPNLDWERRDGARTRRLGEAILNEDLAELGRRLLKDEERRIQSFRDYVGAQHLAGVWPWADVPDGDEALEPDGDPLGHWPAPDGRT